jgi:hypothetical protein
MARQPPADAFQPSVSTREARGDHQAHKPRLLKGPKVDLALAVALVGNLVLIVSVILLGLQVREMAKQSRHGARATLASVYQAMNDNMLQIYRLFIDRPSLRPYFYAAQELTDESPEERERVEATAELFIAFIDNVLTQMPLLPSNLAEPWRTYFRSVTTSSPVLCEFWKRRREWYSAEMRGFLDPLLLGPSASGGPTDDGR